METRILGLLSAALILCLSATWPSATYGQATPSLSEGETYVHRYARPGQATQTIYIWGAVDRPGVWRVHPNTGIVELFSVVHPSGYGIENPATKTNVRLRLHRTVNGDMKMIREMELGRLLEMNRNQRPVIEGGDVIEIRTVRRRTFSIQTVATIVGTLSSVTLLAIRIIRF